MPETKNSPSASGKKKIFEILRYLSCSVVVTVVNWGSYSLFVEKLGLSVTAGNLLSFILYNFVAFFINKLWVFLSFSWKPEVVFKEFTSFMSTRIVSAVVELAGVPLFEKLGADRPFYTLAHRLGITAGFFYTDGIYSKILIGAIVLVLNYVLAKVFVFRGRKKNEASAAGTEENS